MYFFIIHAKVSSKLLIIKLSKNIPESKDGIPKSYRWDDIVYVTVPDIVGKTKKEAKVLLKDFNVEFVGDGDKIFTSSPSSGMKVKMGSTIKVLLN